jgi:hypothetical protein
MAVVCLAGAGALAQDAVAEAIPGPESLAGPSGLPDGRVYEQVSPANKPGSEAGNPVPFISSGLGGDEVVYSVRGPMGETSTGLEFYSISRRSSNGWQSHNAISRSEGFQDAFGSSPNGGLGLSTDMTASIFGGDFAFVPEQEPHGPTPHLYRYSEDGTVQWIGQPLIPDPVMPEGHRGSGGGFAGGALLGYDTVYFEFEGTLTPADEEPSPALGNISRAQEIRAENGSGNSSGGDDGFFEWHDGVLESAGVLPDGHLDPFGAVPAVTGSQEGSLQEEDLHGQVSEDGREAFFLSPDPGSQSGRVPQLYVRKTSEGGAHTTALVSRDLLLPEVGGLPATAPDGGSFMYASPDGTRVFFSSKDQLTASAPTGTESKTYEFDTGTETLVYLPGLDYSTILRTSKDGSNFLFISEKELRFWNEGAITDISAPGGNFFEYRGYGGVHSTSSGSVYAFQAKAAFPALGFNNGGGEHSEVYRYETATNKLSCISCPPTGVTATGDAELSHEGGLKMLTGNHGMSADGNLVFFDTPDGLVPQDTNGSRDAYEWQDGTLYLISTGISQRDSFAGDTSPSGGDLFFSTNAGLAPGDKDEAYDVYDARIPRPGDQLPPSAVPCEGAVCQGPPGVPQLLSPPASAEFDGLGDTTPPPPSHSATKSLTRQQKLTRALKVCQMRKGKSKRAKCRQQAHRRYGVGAAGARLQDNGNRRHNGRGK